MDEILLLLEQYHNNDYTVPNGEQLKQVDHQYLIDILREYETVTIAASIHENELREGKIITLEEENKRLNTRIETLECDIEDE